MSPPINWDEMLATLTSQLRIDISSAHIFTHKLRKMRVVEVLHMNGGIGDTSYANNSLLQVQSLSVCIHVCIYVVFLPNKTYIINYY